LGVRACFVGAGAFFGFVFRRGGCLLCLTGFCLVLGRGVVGLRCEWPLSGRGLGVVASGRGSVFLGGALSYFCGVWWPAGWGGLGLCAF